MPNSNFINASAAIDISGRGVEVRATLGKANASRQSQGEVKEDLAAFELGSLSSFYNNWMAQKNFSPRTKECYLSILGFFTSWLTKNKISFLDTVTPEHIHQFFEFRQHIINRFGRPNGSRTRRSEFTVIRQLFAALYTQNMIPTNPAADLETPRQNRHQLPKIILKTRQVKQLLLMPDLVSPTSIRNRVILEVFYGTGMRRNELCHLTLQDLDFEHQAITIRNGKFQKDRVVPMTSVLAKWLTRYLTEVRPKLLQNIYTPLPDEVVFIQFGGLPITPSIINNTFQPYFKILGVAGNVHLLRHTLATHLIQSGMALRHVQELLGHVSLQATLVYVHLVIDDLKKEYTKCHPRGK